MPLVQHFYRIFLNNLTKLITLIGSTFFINFQYLTVGVAFTLSHLQIYTPLSSEEWLVRKRRAVNVLTNILELKLMHFPGTEVNLKRCKLTLKINNVHS